MFNSGPSTDSFCFLYLLIRQLSLFETASQQHLVLPWPPLQQLSWALRQAWT